MICNVSLVRTTFVLFVLLIIPSSFGSASFQPNPKVIMSSTRSSRKRPNDVVDQQEGHKRQKLPILQSEPASDLLHGVDVSADRLNTKVSALLGGSEVSTQC